MWRTSHRNHYQIHRKNAQERLMKCHKKFHLSYLLKAISFSHDSISEAFSFQVKYDLWMLYYLTIIANENLLSLSTLVSSALTQDTGPGC